MISVQKLPYLLVLRSVLLLEPFCALAMALNLQAAAEPARAQMQEWGRFPMFLTEELWRSLLSAEKQLRKIEQISQHLVALGLRHPSERTFATVAALIAITGNEQMDDDAVGQTALLSTVKSVLRVHLIRAKQMATPLLGGYLTELPATLEGLPQSVRNHFFANGLPQAPVDLNRVWRSGNAWAMRSTHRARQVSSQNPAFGWQQQGFGMSVIAQQAALTTAQTMLALSGHHAQDSLPGLQIFNTGAAWAGGGGTALTTTSAQPREVALQNMLQRAEGPPERSAPLPLMGGSVAATSVVSQTASSRSELPGLPPVAAETVGAVGTTAAPRITETPAVPVESQVSGAADVEDDLLRLAEMHYDSSLPPVVQPREASHEATKAPASVGMKKPAAAKFKRGMKRPAAAQNSQQACSATKVLKRPAATVTVMPSSSSGGMKRPAAAQKAKVSVAGRKEITRAQARKLRPDGCGKCRYQAGCCPSCWRQRNVLILD